MFRLIIHPKNYYKHEKLFPITAVQHIQISTFYLSVDHFQNIFSFDMFFSSTVSNLPSSFWYSLFAVDMKKLSTKALFVIIALLFNKCFPVTRSPKIDNDPRHEKTNSNISIMITNLQNNV